MSSERLLGAIHALARHEPKDIVWLLRRMTMDQKLALKAYWPGWAHDGQLPPDGDWRTWLMMAGRGFGKTRAGAEWVSALARAGRRRAADRAGRSDRGRGRRVMVKGQAGLMAVARADEDLLWYPSRGLVEFSSGAQAFALFGRQSGRAARAASTISPGATSSPNGPIPRRRGTI